MDGDLAGAGAEHEALDAYEVADVEQLLEDFVVQGLVVAGAEVVAADVYLDAAAAVLQLHEGGLAHDAAAHDAPGHAHAARRLVLALGIAEVGLDLVAVARHGILGGGVGLYALAPESLH